MTFLKQSITNHIEILHPRQTILCTVQFEQETNIITLAWTMIISRNPPIVAISVSPKRHSHDLIEGAKEFTLNIPTKQNIKEVFYCGTHSGRTVDKFAETNLTSLDGININCPRIKESIGHIECKVIDSKQYGDHTLFVGEVVTCLWKKDISQETALEEIEIPYHLGGNKFVYNKNKIERV